LTKFLSARRPLPPPGEGMHDEILSIYFLILNQAGGSRCRVVVTPVRIPSPIMQMMPTPIHRGGTWSKCAPIASPTIRTMYPTRYIPNDTFALLPLRVQGATRNL